MSIKKAVIILIIIGVIGLVIVLSVARGKDQVEYSTTAVTRGKIVQTVSETGTLKAADEVDMSFLNSGRIARVHYRIGDTVALGTVLAELDYSDLSIKQEESQASIDVAKEKLNKLLAGPTDYEIKVSKAGVTQTKTAFESAQKELDKTILAQAEKVAQAQKTLADLKSDAISNITPSEQAVITATTNLNNTKSTYQNSIDNNKDLTLVTIEDRLSAASVALDSVNTTLTDEDADDQISKKDPAYLGLTNSSYSSAMAMISDAENALALAKASEDSSLTQEAAEKTLTCLNKVFDCLGFCFSALEHSITSSAFTQTELDAFKTSISTQQTTIGTALSTVETKAQGLSDAVLAYDTNVSAAQDSLGTAEAAYDAAVLVAENSLATAELSRDSSIAASEYKANTAKEAWLVAQAQYNQLIAPANSHDVALARAQVRQAEATLNSVNKQIENSVIKAAIDGTITRVNYEVGEQVSLSQGPVISMLGSTNFEIEVLVSEADIAKVEVNDTVSIDLDAFGEEVKFLGSVNFIEPAETIIQDVIYYQVDIQFDPQEAAVKSGMTANVIITTAEKDNTLFIPSRAVVSRNGSGRYARVLINGQVEEKPITTGLRGDGGVLEVLSGINEGDQVVTYVKNGK